MPATDTFPSNVTHHHYRVDWWSPLDGSSGEWAGNWEVVETTKEACEVALAAIEEKENSLALVLITQCSVEGTWLGRVVVDRATLKRWDPASASLPSSEIDPTVLPPLGREDIETLTLLRCREALQVARDARLIEASHVSAIVQVIQLAFAGLGPAIDMAELADAAATPRLLS